MRKHGLNNFYFSAVDYASTLSELNHLETQWIARLGSRNSLYGYNMTEGGEGGDTSSGLKRSPETIVKMKASSGIARRDIAVEDVVKLYLEGKGSNTIASSLGASSNCILSRLKEAGIQLRPRIKKIKVKKIFVHPRGENNPLFKHEVSSEEVGRLYKDGKTTRQIAKLFGVEKTLIKRRLEESGIKLRLNPREARKARLIAEGKEKFLEIDNRELAHLYNSGYTTEEIAVKFELTHVAVRNRLITEGVTFRHGGKRLKEEWPKHLI
jgi:transposase